MNTKTDSLTELLKLVNSIEVSGQTKEDIRKHVLSLEKELNVAEIQLIGLITAIKGFCSTNPTVTVVGLNNMLPSILKFAREAETEDSKSGR